LKKREEFAISLRKQKTKEIIKEKRRKIMEELQKSDKDQKTYSKSDSHYNGYPAFYSKENAATFEKLLESVAGPLQFDATFS
jgi:hypothetical protein